MSDEEKWSFAWLGKHAIAHAAGYALWTAIAAVGLWLLSLWPPAWQMIAALAKPILKGLSFDVVLPLWAFVLVIAMTLIAYRLVLLMIQKSRAVLAPDKSAPPREAAPLTFEPDEEEALMVLGFGDGQSMNALEIARLAKMARLRVDEALSGLQKKKLVNEITGGMGGRVWWLSDEGRRIVIEKGYVRDNVAHGR